MGTKKENRSRLWRSVDMAYIRVELILYAALWLIMGLIYGLIFENEYVAVMQVVIAVVTLPFLGFHLWRDIRIFRSPEEYIFCRCKLSNPRRSHYIRGAMEFIVLIDDPEYGTVVKHTKPIFFTNGLGVPLLEDYINQTVTVAYNRETEVVVVIG